MKLFSLDISSGLCPLVISILIYFIIPVCFGVDASGWHRKQLGLVSKCYFDWKCVQGFDKKLIVAATQGTIAALNPLNGEVIWRKTSESGYHVEQLRIFCGPSRRLLMAMVRKYGRIGGSSSLNSCDPGIINLIQIDDGQIYFSESVHSRTCESICSLYGYFGILNKINTRRHFYGIPSLFFDDKSIILDVITLSLGDSDPDEWLILLTKSFVKIVNFINSSSHIGLLDLERFSEDGIRPFRLIGDFNANKVHRSTSSQNSKELHFNVIMFSSTNKVAGFIRTEFDTLNKFFTESFIVYDGNKFDGELIDFQLSLRSLVLLYHAYDGESNYYKLILHYYDSELNQICSGELQFSDEFGVSLGSVDRYNYDGFTIYKSGFGTDGKKMVMTVFIDPEFGDISKIELKNKWVLVEDNGHMAQQYGGYGYFLASKEKDKLVFSILDMKSKMMIEYATINLQGTFHNSSNIVSAAWCIVDIGDKKTEFFAVSFNDGIFQFYNDKNLLWETDESLSLIVSAVSIPMSNFKDKFISAGSKPQNSTEKSHSNREEYLKLTSIGGFSNFMKGPFQIYFIIVKIIKYFFKVIFLYSVILFRGYKRFMLNNPHLADKKTCFMRSYDMELFSMPDSETVYKILNYAADGGENKMEKSRLSTDLDNTYVDMQDFSTLRVNLHKILGKNDDTLGDDYIILALSSLSKVTAIHSASGKIIWSRLLTDINWANFSFSKIGSDVVFSNNNGRKSRYGYVVDQVLEKKSSFDAKTSYIIGAYDTCELCLVSETVFCGVCNITNLGDRTKTVIKWFSLIDGAKIDEQHLNFLTTHTLPLQPSLKSAGNKYLAKNLHNALLLCDTSGNAKILYSKIAGHNDGSGGPSADIGVEDSIKEFINENKIMVILNFNDDIYEGYHIDNLEADKYNVDATIAKGQYSHLTMRKKWCLNFRTSNMKVIAIATPEHAEVPIQPMVIMRNLSVYEKFVSSNMVIFITKSNQNEFVYKDKIEKKIMMHIVNAETGGTIYEEILDSEASNPMKMLFHENLIYLHYWHGKQLRYILHTVELFKDRAFSLVDFGLNYFFPLHGMTHAESDYESQYIPMVRSKSHVLPVGIKAMGVTVTRRGITPPSLVIVLGSNMVASIPIHDIGSTESINGQLKAEACKMVNYQICNKVLSSYASEKDLMISFVPINKSYILQNLEDVANIRGIVTSPTKFESYSLVFLYGLDISVCYVHHSEHYDDVQADPMRYSVGVIISFLCYFLIYNSYCKYKNRYKMNPSGDFLL